MIVGKKPAREKSLVRSLSLVIALTISAPLLSSQAFAEEGFGGPSFRKGLWKFVRTLEIVSHSSNGRQKLIEREMTRCVDPTMAMKATFASAPVGNCHSSKPEKVNNRYIFSNRCDYMGPVSTVITVHSDEAYTEVNEITVGQLPRKDLVIAKRIGDCHDEHAALSEPADLPVEQ
ncbi:MAG TPA: DUF3617 family protein [Pyrinomonadaceae bacterium]|nr:DUF3617 family protein [Pyrinomonadaceae bacterium]